MTNPSRAYTAMVRVLGHVPLLFFRVPVMIGGKPHPYQGGEGGLINPPVESFFIATGEPGQPQAYDYGVDPNVPGGHATGRYIVSIYRTAADAQAWIVLAQRRVGVDDAGTPIPFLPVAHPVNPNERLSGEEFPGQSGRVGCMASGFVAYRNVTIEDNIENFASIPLAGTRHCTAEYHWTTRVLRAVYAKVVAYSAQPHHASMVAATFYPTPIPYVIATATPTVAPASALSVEVSVDSDPVADYQPATIQAFTTPGAQCTVSVVYASGYEARSYSLQIPSVADSTGTASWTWTPETKYPGPATGIARCSDGSQTATGEVNFSVQ
jgi:hypothetical protein